MHWKALKKGSLNPYFFSLLELITDLQTSYQSLNDFWTFYRDKKDFLQKKTIAITQEKIFWKPTKNLQKNRQKPIKTDKNRFYFSGPWPDRQIPTVKRVCRFTSQAETEKPKTESKLILFSGLKMLILTYQKLLRAFLTYFKRLMKLHLSLF